jgi:peptidoglycan/LPS O-acetylase OafA/YrhL
MRFAAALAVTCYHFVSSYPSAADGAQPVMAVATSFTRYGYLGVELFFMISGFVILWSSLGRDVLAFAISRVSRLYPSFWVSLVFSMLCITLLARVAPSIGTTPLNLRTILANATMMPAPLKAPLIEGIYWTLEIEIRFYALIVLALLCRQMKRIEAWLCLWLAASVIAQTFEVPWVVKYLTLAPYGPFFIAGCVFYLVFARGMTVLRGVMLAVCAVSCGCAASSNRADFITPDAISAFVVPALTTAFFVIFLLLTLRRGPRGEMAVARRLGELTYPLYLTHASLGVLVYALLRPQIGIAAALAIMFALAFLVAWVITVTVDIPARKPFANLLYRIATALRLPGHAPAKPNAG